MSTESQIAANRQNAQLSTGPVSEAGRERSSQNAIKHGFTGKALFLTPEEQEPYQSHVAAYYARHQPADHRQTHLVQQLADLNWALHQMFVQQSNIMSLMSSLSALAQHEHQDPLATLDALAKATRQLSTLSIYEGRKRRAAQAIEEELATLQQAAPEPVKPQKPQQPQQLTPPPAEVGFVCSDVPAKPQPIRVAPQPGRNELCSCGSGIKYKRCCL
jgi:SEC-C motif